MKITITYDTEYKCSMCGGRGIEYHQPYGNAISCSSCNGTGYANELDRLAQKQNKEKNPFLRSKI